MAKTGMAVKAAKIPNGDITVYGKLYKPANIETDPEGAKLPIIIMAHGYNGWADDFTAECKYYAENGYLVYAFDFSGGSGRSRSTGRTSTEMTIFTEKEDYLAVFDYFYGQDYVDTDRMYIFGGSQGGLVASLVAEERAEKIKAMVLYFPALCVPDDWRKSYKNPETAPDTFDFWGLELGKVFVASIHDFYVFDTIGKFDKNVFILHGDQDRIVPLSYSEKAVELYPHATLKVMQGEGHGFGAAAGKTAMEDVLDFIREN